MHSVTLALSHSATSNAPPGFRSNWRANAVAYGQGTNGACAQYGGLPTNTFVIRLSAPCTFPSIINRAAPTPAGTTTSLHYHRAHVLSVSLPLFLPF